MRPLEILSLLLGVLAVCTTGQGDGRAELHIAFITSFEGEFDSSVTVPAVQLATEQVNNDTSVLTDYRLVVELIDNVTVARRYANSKCSRYNAQRTFVEQITSGRNKVALIGCGCSLATEPVAEISRFWNITHISYTPSSDYLSNRDLFPTLWKTFPSEGTVSSSLIAIMRQYNWEMLKIITQDEDLFTNSGQRLRSDLADGNITIDDDDGINLFSTQSNVYNLTEEELFPDETRVFFLNMYPLHARRIMCKAAISQQERPSPERHYPGYVWITLGWYHEDWWRQYDAAAPDCTDEDLEPYIRNTFAIQLGNSTLNSSSPTQVGLTTTEFESALTDKQAYNPGSLSSVAYLAYDAVWTLALAIERALPSINTRGLEPDLSNFNYTMNGQLVTQLITAQLNQSDFAFTGVSGEVRFDANGSRVPSPAKIFKYRVSNNSIASVQRKLIAVDNRSSLEYIEGENDNTTWPAGVPFDGTPVVVINTYYTAIYVIYDIAVVIGICFAIVCLLFNFIFRKRKIVRLISPNLNYFIIFGAILMYISIIFFVFPTKDPFLVTFACNFRAWTQSLGYFMCFGTIVAKMWRVYFIFNHPQVQVTKQRQRAIKDWHLMMIVLALCSVVVIFFTAVAIFGNYRAKEVQDNERADSRNEFFVLQDSHTLVCDGPKSIFWIVAFFAYILITQLISMFLAFRTRKVKIKALNDAKYVALIIYMTTVVAIVMIACAVLLNDRLNADGAVFGGLFYIFATIVLTVLFIPKMVILYKDPKGEKIFERTQSVSQTGNYEVDVDNLEKHCRDLENRLGRYETVAPYRSLSQSSIRKFSASTGFLASLPPSSLSGPTPSSPMHTINPTLSLPVTPVKYNSDINETKMTNGTSGYLSESPTGDKVKQTLTFDLPDEGSKTVAAEGSVEDAPGSVN